jgi:hypothetical protein
MTNFDDLVKRIDATLADEVALLMSPAPPPAIEPAEVTLDRIADYVRQLEDDLPKPPDKIKLTKAEWDTLRAANPPIDRAPSLLDVPVELVDNPEESTLYRPPCCDLHNQHCEVPFDVCCDGCPQAVALVHLAAEHEQDWVISFDPPRSPWWRRWWSW